MRKSILLEFQFRIKVDEGDPLRSARTERLSCWELQPANSAANK